MVVGGRRGRAVAGREVPHARGDRRDPRARPGAAEGDLICIVADVRRPRERRARRAAPRPRRPAGPDPRGRLVLRLDDRPAALRVERGRGALGLGAPPLHRAEDRRPRARDGDGARVRPRAERVRARRRQRPDPPSRDPAARVRRAGALARRSRRSSSATCCDAFTFGAPPHGGIAMGLDRLTMLLAGKETIRDVTAFPKTQSGADPLTGAPAPATEEQLRDLGLRLVAPPLPAAAPGPGPAKPTRMNEPPLAARMRPRSFDEFVGQGHLVGRGQRPRQARWRAATCRRSSCGGRPAPGRPRSRTCSPTPSARSSQQLSAVSSGVADARKVMEGARGGLFRTVLFVDEVHRWSKAQQDVLLPGGRGRHGHVDRRDHREPLLLAEHAAALAVPAAAARAPRDRRRSRTLLARALERSRPRARPDSGSRDRRRPRHLVTIAGGDARMALTGLEAAALAAEAAAPRRSRSRSSPTPSRRRRSCTTARATRTTT